MKHRVVQLQRTETEQGVAYQAMFQTIHQIAGLERPSLFAVDENTFRLLHIGDVLELKANRLIDESPFSASLSPAEVVSLEAPYDPAQ